MSHFISLLPAAAAAADHNWSLLLVPSTFHILKILWKKEVFIFSAKKWIHIFWVNQFFSGSFIPLSPTFSLFFLLSCILHALLNSKKSHGDFRVRFFLHKKERTEVFILLVQLQLGSCPHLLLSANRTSLLCLCPTRCPFHASNAYSFYV